jgi:predicted transcriptional regulator
MKKNTKIANDWLDELMKEKFCTAQVDVVPAGWITLNEMAEQYQLPMTTMNSRVIKLMKLGLVQRKKFRIITGRCISEVWHYYKKSRNLLYNH